MALGMTLPRTGAADWALRGFGHNTALRAWTVVMFTLTASIFPFVRPRLPPARARQFDPTFLKRPVSRLFQAGNIVNGLGLFIPSAYLFTYAEQFSASDYPPNATLMVPNAASLTSWIGMGFLVDRFLAIKCILLSVVTSAIAVLLFLRILTTCFHPFKTSACRSFFAGCYNTT